MYAFEIYVKGSETKGSEIISGNLQCKPTDAILHSETIAKTHSKHLQDECNLFFRKGIEPENLMFRLFGGDECLPMLVVMIAKHHARLTLHDAGGGTGKECVEALKRRGVPVKAVVRNEVNSKGEKVSFGENVQVCHSHVSLSRFHSSKGETVFWRIRAGRPFPCFLGLLCVLSKQQG